MVLGILVVACRITIKEEKMWSSCMAPQGHNFPSSLLSRSQNVAYKQQNREFGLFTNSIPLSSAKSFKNPNFLNDFKNHSHIIDKIKEKCPEVIPKFGQVHSEVLQQQPQLFTSMCSNSDDNMIPTKQRKREHDHKGKKQMHASKKSSKKSKQLSQKKEIKELMQIDINQDIANLSLDITFSQNHQEEPHNFILADFIAQRPFKAHPPLKKTDPIHIPISKGAEMFVVISPSPNSKSFTQISLTDSEDSFIVFENHDEDNEEETEEESLINIKNVQRNRYPSVCESEDSFIVFDGGNEETDDDSDDTSFLSSSEEDSISEDEEVSEFDEVDCSAAHSCDRINRTRDRKKVTFVSDEKLCEVHSMIKWSYAYQAARKGPWEMYARDRCRFRDRIFKVESDIKNIFNRKHRERIYKERFENLIN